MAKMANRKTPIALVGCGNWGKNILRDLVALGCEVHVVARSPESRARAKQGGAASIVASTAELQTVAGSVVAAPTELHADVIDELLSRQPGPIYCEKPLTNSPARARIIAEKAGDRVFVMDKWRYHAGILELASISRSGELGLVQGLACVRNGWGNGRSTVDAIWHLAPHDLSIALEILGDIPAAKLARADYAANGAAYGLFALLGNVPWVSVECSTRAPEPRRAFKLYCRDGVAMLNESYADHVEVVAHAAGRLPAKPTIERRPVSTKLPLLAELEAFIGHVRGGPAPKSSVAQGALIVHRLDELHRMADAAAAASMAA